ncbi:MAG: hypothetical protein WD875_15205 [Pirellulales bacterium]
MSIKTPSDLESQAYIRVDLFEHSGTNVEVWINIKPIYVHWDDTSGRPAANQIKVDTSGVVWRVRSVNAAEAGWGPFLYDVAMELATLDGKGLCSDPSHVTEDALKVWEFYFTRRNDVARKKLPRKIWPTRRDECIQYFYSKSPSLIIPELKRLGKWCEVHQTSLPF